MITKTAISNWSIAVILCFVMWFFKSWFTLSCVYGVGWYVCVFLPYFSSFVCVLGFFSVYYSAWYAKRCICSVFWINQQFWINHPINRLVGYFIVEWSFSFMEAKKCSSMELSWFKQRYTYTFPVSQTLANYKNRCLWLSYFGIKDISYIDNIS